jgi:hypothetical protein
MFESFPQFILAEAEFEFSDGESRQTTVN